MSESKRRRGEGREGREANGAERGRVDNAWDGDLLRIGDDALTVRERVEEAYPLE